MFGVVLGEIGLQCGSPVHMGAIWQILFWCNGPNDIKINSQKCDYFQNLGKVIYPKYSKHWAYTVPHTIDCVCSKMLNHGLNHGLFLSLFKLIPCHIHWIVYVLAYLNFIFEF